jgi:hypothetical protein
MKDFKLVKKNILLLIKIARHLCMEKEILELNIYMLQNFKNSLPGNSVFTFGVFSGHIDELQSKDELLLQQGSKVLKINYKLVYIEDYSYLQSEFKAYMIKLLKNRGLLREELSLS